MLKLLLALIALALPLRAEEAANIDPTAQARPGAVAALMAALDLADQGQAAKDPLVVLTAARLMRGLAVVATARLPDRAKQASPAGLPAFDAEAMIATAKSLDAGDSYIDLIEMVARETPPAPRQLRATPSSLAPGASESWTLPFYAGSVSELGVLAATNSALDFLVTDAAGHHICEDAGTAAKFICAFTPQENGDFVLTVTNRGAATTSYALITP
jgi:hypothetical protein